MASSSTMEENDYYPKSLQEELNEITEAFYSLISEEEICGYQAYLEHLQGTKVAQGALKAPFQAPDFELPDQDGDLVSLANLLKQQQGPVVLVFYRGKWCPHCNATLIAYQGILPQIQAKGAQLVAISPMLPDGTQVFATKRDLQFRVLSDCGNHVGRLYHLTWTIPECFRPMFARYVDGDDDLSSVNGKDSSPWEIPCPAVYIINKQGTIVWSFIDNDPACRAEPDDILAAIPTHDNNNNNCQQDNNNNNNRNGDSSKQVRGGLKNTTRKLFGKNNKQPAHAYLGQFLLRTSNSRQKQA